MRQYLLALVLIASSLILSPNHLLAAKRSYIDIGDAGTRKINIAVPWFTHTDPSIKNKKEGRDLAILLGKSLEFHGIISILPIEQYRDNQSANWKSLGVDYAILGRYDNSQGSLQLTLRLLDVSSNDMILGKSYSSSQRQRAKMIFTYCDSVIESLTGTSGIANSRIAFINRKKRTKEVYLTDIIGNSFRRVTRHKHLTVSPRFVPNGPYLSYTSYHSGNQNLYITDLRQSKVTRSLSRRKGLNLAPTWFSDGRKMILTLSKGGNPDLYLLDRQGKIIEKITDRAGINVSPTLSPDGAHLVFVSDRSGGPQLYYMNMKTKKVKRLTFEGSENAEPNWSPTENRIVYSSLRNGVYQLFTLNPLTDEPPKQVTTDLSHHESPCWSPDGNQIIFAKRGGKKHQIYGIMKDGSFQRRLFGYTGSQTYPQWAK